MSLESRFWSKVAKAGPDECWLWTGARNEHGYGVMRPEGQRTGPTIKAHRVALELAGISPGELHALHSCDNPPCVNPAHLRAGTIAENASERDAKGRGNRGSRNGAAKLAEPDITEIRRRLGVGHRHRDIAADFGVSRSRITMIANGHGWRHVAA